MPDRVGPAVLVVEDDAAVRQLLVRWIERIHDGPVVSAADGETALDVLAAGNVAVAFCDQTLPGQGGDWLLQQMRERFPTVAIILATGNAALPERVALQPGVVGYLVKPFEGELVTQVLSDALLWHRVASRSSRPT
jgi:CheY-like chemotaxis protein